MLILILVVILTFGSIHPASGLTIQDISQNYLGSVNLPRDGKNAKSSQSKLELVVHLHNQTLTENPAPKNRNRIVYLDGPKQYKPVNFPVTPNTTVVDGSGRIMGHLAPGVSTVEINFGQHKLIDGEDHVMAFAAYTKEAGTVTGWIASSVLLPSAERSQFTKELAMNVMNTPEQGDAPVSYRVRCASSDKWDNGRLKVRANINDNRNKHVAATDYVARPGGVCYLLTALPGHGGVATDILSNGVRFVPAAGTPRVNIPLYLPVNATISERDAWKNDMLPHWMEFSYGRVGTRYGWIATANLSE